MVMGHNKILMGLLACLILASAGCSALPTKTSHRYALVIGNATYADARIGTLPNVINDREDMCTALAQLKFKVSCLADLKTKEQFLAAVRHFGANLPSGAEVMLYYAGHGIEYSGEKFLIPTDISADDLQAFLKQTVSLSSIFENLNQKDAAFQFVVVDACRETLQDSPTNTTTESKAKSRGTNFWLGLVRGAGTQTNSPGVPAVLDVPSNSIILFATGAGRNAYDGARNDRNGTLTKHLLKNLKAQNTEITDMTKSVIKGVKQETAGWGQAFIQEPTLYIKYTGKYCFLGCQDKSPVAQVM